LPFSAPAFDGPLSRMRTAARRHHARVAGFRVGYVFDLADTEGEDLPDDGLNVVHPVGVAPEGMWDTLVQRVEEPASPSGQARSRRVTRFRLGPHPLRGPVGDGQEHPDPAGACKTLAHELGARPAARGPSLRPRGTVEVEASPSPTSSPQHGGSTPRATPPVPGLMERGDVTAVTATPPRCGLRRTILESTESTESGEDVVPA